MPTRIGRTKVLLVDTPGFNDAVVLENIVSSEIPRFLIQQYRRGVSLRGVIYLQCITEKKIIGSPASILKLFRGICGDLFLQNVILVTTRWQLQEVNEEAGAAQEHELRYFWGPMLDRKSTIWRYYGDRDSGVGIIGRILGNEDVPFETKQELIAKSKALERKLHIATEIVRLQWEMEELNGA